MLSESREQIIDAEHLRLLALTYYISAAMTGLFALFGLFYAAMGLMFTGMAASLAKSPDGPPPEFGWFFVAVGVGLFALMAAFSGLKIYAARCVRGRRRRLLCFAVAALTCLEMPYGTALGVVTFVVLTRPSIAALFETT